MTLEAFRELCLSFPAASEEIKWENDLCFLIGKKMFAVAGLDRQPVSISFKTSPKLFDQLTERSGFVPAPYLARYKWVSIQDISGLNEGELKTLVSQSYELVLAKLPSKVRNQLEL